MSNIEFNSIALGHRIRSLRKEKGMTQEKMAEMVGISLSFWGHIERGSRIMSIETLIRIANSLNASVDDLLQDSLPRVLTARSVRESELFRSVKNAVEKYEEQLLT